MLHSSGLHDAFVWATCCTRLGYMGLYTLSACIYDSLHLCCTRLGYILHSSGLHAVLVWATCCTHLGYMLHSSGLHAVLICTSLHLPGLHAALVWATYCTRLDYELHSNLKFAHMMSTCGIYAKHILSRIICCTLGSKLSMYAAHRKIQTLLMCTLYLHALRVHAAKMQHVYM